MDRPIWWTDAALNDLDAIAEFIGRDSAVAAATFVHRAFDTADTLIPFPMRGHVVPEFDEPNLREVSYRGYRLIYEIHGEAVSIMGLIHGARDLYRLWDDREKGAS